MDDVAFISLGKHEGAFADLLILPWSEHNLVTKMHDEGVHAVSLGRQLYGAAFGDQRPYLLHHCFLVYRYRAHNI